MNPSPDVVLTALDGDARPLEEWLTTFHLASVVLDPFTNEPMKTTFNEARLRLIHDTNVRQALAAGQWQRMLRNQARFPYARYVSMDDSRVRADHRTWHNTVLPINHPWWATHRPPNGYHCRCRVVALTRAEFERGYSESRPGAETDEGAPMVTRMSGLASAIWRSMNGLQIIISCVDGVRLPGGRHGTILAM